MRRKTLLPPILLWLSLILLSQTTRANDRARYIEEVTAYVDAFFKEAPRRKARFVSKKRIEQVVDISMKYDVDPLLTAASFISLESSWNPRAVGKLGEVGLMQVHCKAAKKGFNLKLPAQQIEAGVKWLSKSIKKCGSVRRGVDYYATNRCQSDWKMLGYRMKKYHEAVRRFRHDR